MADAITNAQSGQAVNLGKRAHWEKVRFFQQPRNEVEWFVKKLEIRLVHNQQRMVRNSIDECLNIIVRGECAGWVVWVGDENNAGIGRDGLRHGV